MRIHNVRLGFATNSSSTHSMIFLKGAKDKIVGDGNYDFGWEHFTAASRKTKEAYFAILVMDALRGMSDDHTAALVASDLLGRDVSDIGEGYIDHQSMYGLPANWAGNALNYEFAKELRDFILQDDLVILGGSDNDDKDHPLSKGNSFRLGIPQESDRRKLVARKDPQGFWTVFNRETGAKMRFTFPQKGVKPKKDKWRRLGMAGMTSPTKAYAPELIDIKITDFCPRKCYFCYQGSGPTGQHASWENSYDILRALQELNVFEVAIGGGEPTAHPNFVQILQGFRSHGIVPSFSTRDLSWLKDPIRWRPILEAAGSFAYSVDESDQSIEEFAAVLNANGFRSGLRDLVPQPTVHHVMIGGWNGNFEEFLHSAYHHSIHVVLLGYKFTGRGANQKPKDHDDWVDVVVKLNEKGECPRLSIDTTLAKTFAHKLKAAGIPDWLIETKEGSFSMYIDLVASKMGPSSFCPVNELVDLDWTNRSYKAKDQILKAFASW